MASISSISVFVPPFSSLRKAKSYSSGFPQKINQIHILQANIATTCTDVVIVGAGAAGLSAARTLIARGKGHKITILEATDRIGGRICSKTLGNTRVEMGAEEHYGATGGNPVYTAVTDEYGTGMFEEGFTGA